MDTFVEDYPETMEWLRHNHGELSTEAYASAGERHAQVLFAADFDGAEAFLAKPGVADAIFSYWGSYLKKMGHSQSLYARYHNYNAAAAIANRLRDRLATMRQPQTR